MRPSFPLLFVGLIYGSQCFASTGATVVVLRGTAKTGDGKALAEKQKVTPGTTVVTSARSFVRLLFPDNTQLNVGPDTTMKIETTKAGEASLVDLVGGQIRAKVVKDPMAGQNGSPVKDKMVIKTKTAAMGVRGTDFNVSFNSKNFTTALITFEGNVAMAKIGAGANPYSALQGSSGVQSVGAGQFSGSNPDQALASIPVKISPSQLESLKGNADFQGLGEKSAKQSAMASPVPPGVDPKGFSSGSEQSLKDAVAKTVGESNLNAVIAEAQAKEPPAGKATAPAEGFFDKSTGEYAPRAGGFIDLSTGLYVPPPAGSSFDPNTGVFVPPLAMGSISADGMYVPPKGVDLDPVNGFVAEAVSGPAAGERSPSGVDAPSTENALITAMNNSITPEASTQMVTLDSSFSGGGAVSGGMFESAPPPPPPADSLPPPPADADPENDYPVSGNCATDNSCGGTTTTPVVPTSSDVNFQINVTD